MTPPDTVQNRQTRGAAGAGEGRPCPRGRVVKAALQRPPSGGHSSLPPREVPRGRGGSRGFSGGCRFSRGPWFPVAARPQPWVRTLALLSAPRSGSSTPSSSGKSGPARAGAPSCPPVSSAAPPVPKSHLPEGAPCRCRRLPRPRPPLTPAGLPSSPRFRLVHPKAKDTNSPTRLSLN